jgi:Carboxypeptidase regulatory-like domain/TonB dependent receptor
MSTTLARQCLVLSLSLPLLAQVDRASLNGTITDPSGAVVAGASIDVYFASTGFKRAVLSSGAGTYVISALPIGRCQITVHATGFQSQQILDLVLTVGETRTLDFPLTVSTSTDTIQVAASAVALEQDTAETGGVIGSQQVKGLPINGRNWAGLMVLIPGAINTGIGNQTGIRFAGHGLDDNKLVFDGADATGILRQSQKTDLRLQISSEAIAEFRVNSSLYSAEFGGAGGGQADVVSKSGSDAFRGSLFEFFRNDKLNSRSPFDPSTVPPFHLNQFGGSLGGPIVKDRTFFFINNEGLRQTLGQTLIGFVPSDSYRAKVLQTSPQLQAILNTYPLGQTATTNSNVSSWTGAGRQVQNENFALVKIDHRFSDATTAYARFNLDQGQLQVPNGDSSGYLRDTLLTDDAPKNGILELQHIFSPNLINETTAGVNRVPFTTTNQSALPIQVQVAGLTTLRDNLQQIQHSTTYSGSDTLSFVHGRHSLKAGFGLRRVQINLGNSAETQLTYANANNFATDALDSAAILASVPDAGARKTEYSAFVQDEIKLKPNVTLSLGLRYDYFGVFSELKNRARAFDPETCGGFCAPAAAWYNPDPTNAAPRVALTWAPTSLHGKTVIRTGYGLYYGEAQLGDLTGPLNNITSRITLTSAQIAGLTYPVDPFIALGQSIGNAPRALFRNRRNQRIGQWGFSVQQQLPGQMLLDVGYLGNKGTHMFTRTYTNAINPLTGQRALAGFSLTDYKRMDGNSEFNGLSVTLKRQFSNGWLLGANYLWSHNIDDAGTGGGEAVYPQEIACRSCERASADQDVRHSFTSSAIYQLPFGPERKYLAGSGVAGKVLGGWELSGIGTARTGVPVNVTVSRSANALPDGNSTSPQRPDLVPGVSLVPTGGQTPGNWINPAAFAIPANGTWGNAGRNLVRAPGLWQIDTALTKRNRISEQVGLEFRAEAFNLLNHSQFGLPNANFSALGSFGRITQPLNSGATGTGTPRQLQLMLRLSF